MPGLYRTPRLYDFRIAILQLISQSLLKNRKFIVCFYMLLLKKDNIKIENFY